MLAFSARAISWGDLLLDALVHRLHGAQLQGDALLMALSMTGRETARGSKFAQSVAIAALLSRSHR